MTLFLKTTGLILGALALVLGGSVNGAKAQDKATDNAAKELRSHVEALIKAAGGNRTAGHPGAVRSVEWLKKEAQKIGGWEVAAQSFDPDIASAVDGYKKDLSLFERLPKDNPTRIAAENATAKLIGFVESLRGKKGTNLVLRKKGSDPGAANAPLVVSAHYDTITNTPTAGRPRPDFRIYPDAPAPGVDDNGIAVAAVLRLAGELKDLKPKRTLELVFFDFEEEFFLGSRAYAKGLASEGKRPEIVNLEMIGWDKPEPQMTKVYCRSAGRPGGERDLQIAQVLTKHLAAEKLTALAMCNNFDRSDHWSFWQEGFPGVAVTQDWERNFNVRHYHTKFDSPENADWAYSAQIYRGVKNGILELVR